MLYPPTVDLYCCGNKSAIRKHSLQWPFSIWRPHNANFNTHDENRNDNKTSLDRSIEIVCRSLRTDSATRTHKFILLENFQICIFDRYFWTNFKFKFGCNDNFTKAAMSLKFWPFTVETHSLFANCVFGWCAGGECVVSQGKDNYGLVQFRFVILRCAT